MNNRMQAAEPDELSTDDMIKIMVEETCGKQPSVQGRAADAFRADVKRDIAKAKARGQAIEIPHEW